MNPRVWLLITAIGLLTPVQWATAADADPSFQQWEPEIAAFERSDATNPPPKEACLFIGSSTIRFWTTLAGDFPDQSVINRGFGGSQIADATHFADRVIFPYAPRLIFLRAGGNDLWAGKPVAQVFADFQEFARTVHTHLPAAQIIFISLSPTPSRWKQAGKELALNGLVKSSLQRQPWLHFIDTYSLPLGPDGRPRAELFRRDQLHFNAAGYQLLAAAVRADWPTNISVLHSQSQPR